MRWLIANPAVLNILNDATCYVDDALHHQSGDAFQVQLGEERDNLLARIAQLGLHNWERKRAHGNNW